MHWPWYFTWWTVIGVGLYVLCLTGSIRARTSAGSWWFAMPAPVVAIYAAMPGVLRIAEDSWGWALSVIVPMAFLGVLPLYFQSRKVGAEEQAAKAARTDHAEQVIRNLGA